ncbi:MAG: NAD(P)H-hydrate epimerase [Planctomycetota bacterium]
MSREQVRSVDAWAINELLIPGVVLMENAGRSCAELIRKKLAKINKPNVCIFCGTGNNGGDGYVIARHLLNSGFEITVVVCGDCDRVKGDARINLDILRAMALPIKQLGINRSNLSDKVSLLAADSDMIVDGIFGTGLRGQLRNDYKQLITSINSQNKPIFAIDIPSGLDCDTGLPLATAIKADYTVTFVAVKKGFVSNKTASKYTGEVWIASIGIEPGLKQA